MVVHNPKKERAFKGWAILIDVNDTKRKKIMLRAFLRLLEIREMDVTLHTAPSFGSQISQQRSLDESY